MIFPPPRIVSTVSQRIGQTVAAESREDFHRFSFRAMSTPARICFREKNRALALDFQRAVLDWISAFEARYSRFIPQSIIGQINASAGGDWLEIDAETEQLLSLCDQMHAQTGGIFDAAMLPLLRLWDWKATPPRIPDSPSIAAAMQISGWDKIQRSGNRVRLALVRMGIDLGGIGKEYAVDHVFNMARERGMSDFLVDIGQDLRVSGQSPGKDAWYIGLEEPATPGTCWTSVRVNNDAVATSGDYLRSFTQEGNKRRYGHILDPRNGQPVNNDCQSVNVIAPNCVLAGVLSTSAFIAGPVDGLKLIQSLGCAQACITTATARYQTREFSNYVPA